MNTVLAWHFTNGTLRDGSPVPAIGEPLEEQGELVICRRGLHASRHPWDALGCSPGSILHRVECSGKVLEGSDKLVCSRRVILQTHDVEGLLRRFAKDQALLVITQWDAPQIVVDYLRGDDESLRAEAWEAARNTAWAAAWEAVRDEAWEAAWGAAWEAAWGAACGAAREAARAAVRAAAGEAAWEAARAAACGAAREAVRAAAWAAAGAEFKARVERLFDIGRGQPGSSRTSADAYLRDSSHVATQRVTRPARVLR
jgi:hypothetical protein